MPHLAAAPKSREQRRFFRNARRKSRQRKAELRLEQLEPIRLLSSNAISGFVYHDLNNNGLFDPGEPPIANSPIVLRNAQGDIIGQTVTDANGFYEFTIDETISTEEQTITHTIPIPEQATNFTDTASIPQFDPALGELLSAEIRFTGTIRDTVGVENTGPTPGTITVEVEGEFELNVPGFDPSVFASQFLGSFDASAFDGIIDFAGTSGTTFSDEVTSDPVSATLTGADLLPYLGTGSLLATFEAIGSSDVSGTANMEIENDTRASAEIQVVYRFIADNSLQPGDYIIEQTEQPEGFLDGLDSRDGVVMPGSAGGPDLIPVTLIEGQDALNNNFGELLPASLAGFVYVDANNNGIFEPGETPIPGVTITLTGTDDLGESVLETTTTDATGLYTFDILRPGTYTISQTQPEGFLDGKDTQGTPGTGTTINDAFVDITLAQGVDGQDNNFGELLPASLSGFVYHDINNNGIREVGEPGIGGVTIILGGTDDRGDAVNLTTVTDTSGFYIFDDLRPGTYSITEVQPDGWLDGKDSLGTLGGQIAPGGDQFTSIVVAAAAVGENYNFGELLPGALSGFVYFDANNNGIKEAGESGISGVTITLTGTDDLGAAVSQTTTTDTAGFYQFGNLRPGTYSITENQPDGWLDGKDSLGTLGGQIAAGGDRFTSIVVASAAVGENYNFGELLPSSLGGFVYLDRNDNGIREPELGEHGISGVWVHLSGFDDRGQSVVFSIQTGMDGSYLFDNLRPGVYSLIQHQPENFIDGKDTQGTPGNGSMEIKNAFLFIELASNIHGQENNFGELLPPGAQIPDPDDQGTGVLSGFVYHDLNNNGIREPGEPGIGGVTITLTGIRAEDGQTFTSVTTTNDDGSYGFFQLPEGTYTITQTQPEGFLDGKDSLGTLGGEIAPGGDQFTSIVVAAGAFGQEYNFGEILPSSLSGWVWFNVHERDNIFDHNDLPVANVELVLSGVDDLGQSVLLTTMSAVDGTYRFENLRPGVYHIFRVPPQLLDNGPVTVGSLGGEALVHRIIQIPVSVGVEGINYNFAQHKTCFYTTLLHNALNQFVRGTGQRFAHPVIQTHFPMLTGRMDTSMIPPENLQRATLLFEQAALSMARRPFPASVQPLPNPVLQADSIDEYQARTLEELQAELPTARGSTRRLIVGILSRNGLL